MKDNPKNINIKHAGNRRGVALLVVLFLVGTISILSLAFAIKADTELSCGKNVELRMDMEYLGLTSLNYAKSLILNPQDVTTGTDGYWQGGTALQMEEGNDYFDIEVVRSKIGDTPECTYDISCQAYRLDGGVRFSETKLQAQLRLDPCIAYWAGGSNVMHSNMKVYGDVYCDGNLNNSGEIYGDVFTYSYLGSRTGVVASLSNADVSWPDIDAWRFEPNYYIDMVSYKAVFLDENSYTDVDWGPTASNPAGIYYSDGVLRLHGNNKINGTLIVIGGHLDFEDGQTTITSIKNYPAIVVESDLHFKKGGVVITGLVQADIATVNKDYGDIIITGGLFVKDQGIEFENGYSGNVIVRGDPMKASIKLMSTSENMMEWSPVGGAYFKSIKRDDSD